MIGSPDGGSLAGRVVALPESRRLEVLAGLLERRGARVRRCPLVAIHDTPDDGPVEHWLREFIARPPDMLILLTGEGLRRLLGFSERAGLRESFVETLAAVRKLTRGPKPARALRELGLETDLAAPQPTTDGVIDGLRGADLDGRDVAVQLYGQQSNPRLTAFLEGAGAAVRAVAPYVYASDTEDEQVRALIRELAAGEVDALALTSSPQYRRLRQVARGAGLVGVLEKGLARTTVAAVGPVVAERLRADRVRVDAVPDSSYAMKPLVNALARALAARAGAG